MPLGVEGRPIEILLVEDNPGDVRLTQEALRETTTANKLHVARDGVEAVAFLRGEGAHAKAPRPDLVVLDLNLPRMGGFEVLEFMKGDRGLKTIPVVILTTSGAERDVDAAYRLHASCYLRKPVDFDRFREVVQSIEGFWLRLVTYATSGMDTAASSAA